MQFIFDYVHSIFVLQDGLPGEQIYMLHFSKKKKKQHIHNIWHGSKRGGLHYIRDKNNQKACFTFIIKIKIKPLLQQQQQKKREKKTHA